jgi:hypothetical protein
MQRFFVRLVAIAVCSFAVACLAAPAFAQSAPAALPTAPGAGDKVNSGGRTAAAASVPAAPGRSPLEPYLVVWLLPVSGVLVVIWAIAVDRSVRASGAKAATGRR